MLNLLVLLACIAPTLAGDHAHGWVLSSRGDSCTTACTQVGLGCNLQEINGVDTAAEVEQPEESVANDTEEEVVYQKMPKRKRRVVVVQDSSSEEEIEVKLPKQKKSGVDGNDEVYRRAYQRMFELH